MEPYKSHNAQRYGKKDEENGQDSTIDAWHELVNHTSGAVSPLTTALKIHTCIVDGDQKPNGNHALLCPERFDIGETFIAHREKTTCKINVCIQKRTKLKNKRTNACSVRVVEEGETIRAVARLFHKPHSSIKNWAI